VADLWAFKPKASDLPLGDKRVDPQELTTYRVTANLVKARFVDDPPKSNRKGGGDRDYHLVIAALTDRPKTMIVEFPDPACVRAADPKPEPEWRELGRDSSGSAAKRPSTPLQPRRDRDDHRGRLLRSPTR
jgi:hypothetical protein